MQELVRIYNILVDNDNAQTSSNISVGIANEDAWLLITPYLNPASTRAKAGNSKTVFHLFSDKPEFIDVPDVSVEKVFTVEEGKAIQINLSAKANPPEIEYKWTSPGRGNIPGNQGISVVYFVQLSGAFTPKSWSELFFVI